MLATPSYLLALAWLPGPDQAEGEVSYLRAAQKACYQGNFFFWGGQKIRSLLSYLDKA